MSDHSLQTPFPSGLRRNKVTTEFGSCPSHKGVRMNALPMLPATMVYSRRVTHIRFWISFLIALLAWNVAPAAHAQERTKIAVGYSAIAVSQVVPWIIARRDFLRSTD